jgi:dTDP-4-dehydrorhamnose reductase/intein/homing endonuclease
MKIYVLGKNGMLGRYVYTYFKSEGYDVIGLTRNELDVMNLRQEELHAKFIHMKMDKNDVVINCIGMIRQRKDINNADFIYINSMFPIILANVCEMMNMHLIHPTTDCFLPDTKVLTDNGYINIQNLKINENVYTHTGEIKKINNFLFKTIKEKIYNIKTLGNDYIKCTNNHPWYVIKREKREIFDFNNIEWIKTKDLKVGNLIAIPKIKILEQVITIINLLDYSNEYKKIYDEYEIFINEIKDKNINIKKYCSLNNLNYRKIIKWKCNENIKPKICKLNSTLNINKNTSWLLGLFLAEGWVNNNKNRKTITITLGDENNLINNTISIIKKELNINPNIRYMKNQKGCQITFTHQLLSEMLSKDFYINENHYSHTKKIPLWIHKIGKENLISFIKGYLDGDGCFFENENTTFISVSSTSEFLIDDLKVLFMKLGFLPNKSNFINKGVSNIGNRLIKVKNKYNLCINGKQLEKIFDMLNINSKYFNNKNRYNKFFENENYWFVPITDIQEEYYDGLVYNLEVEDNHSYLVNGGLSAHNCVFDGTKGQYIEDDLQNATDVYGKTKSLGETTNATLIRTSIIGEEVGQSRSLVEWVKSNKDKTVNGYINHKWNGVTCLQWSKICQHIIDNNMFWNGVRHIKSPNVLNKHELVCLISDVYELNLTVNPFKTEKDFDMSLSSKYNTDIYIPELIDQIIEMKNFYPILSNNNY